MEKIKCVTIMVTDFVLLYKLLFYLRGSFKKFYLLDHIFALENGAHSKFSTIIPLTFGYIVWKFHFQTFYIFFLVLQTPQRDLVHQKRIKSSGKSHVLGRHALPLSLVYKERELFSWTITVHKPGTCSKAYNMAASHEQTAPLFDKEQIRTVIKFNVLLNRAAIDIQRLSKLSVKNIPLTFQQ